MISLILSITLNAQVRPDILSFTDTEQTDLANLIIEFVTVTPEILQYHCDYVAQSGVDDIHSDFDFLPFHRTYLERLEDWLVSKGHSKFVPLPKWTGKDTAPTVFNIVASNCADTTCGQALNRTCNAPTSANWNRAKQSLPNYLSLPVQSGFNDDICDWRFSPTSPGAEDMGGLSKVIEGEFRNAANSEWHNFIHFTMGGVMGNFRSPASAIFWLWHAMVDDVWKSWEQHCSQSTTSAVDLYIKDNDFVMESKRDRGEEPNIDTGPMWESKDIWVRNQTDGDSIQEHQNPKYGQANYVYVRVRNRGYQTSLGTEKLKLYWAKANTALAWPANWDGSLTVGTDQVSLGALLGTKSISQVKAQGQTILQFRWYPPNPASYTTLVDNPQHFCLLARIVAENDPMANEVNGSIQKNARNNNNIAWKNLSIIDLRTTAGQNTPAGATIFIGNVGNTKRNFYIELGSPENPGENGILDEAEVKVTMDQKTWDKWETSREAIQLQRRSGLSSALRSGLEGAVGGQSSGTRHQERPPTDQSQISQELFQMAHPLEILSETRQVLVREDKVSLKNLEFKPNERTQINVRFNFLVKKMSGQKEFDFHVIQRATGTNEIIGGETFHIIANNNRQGFFADAGKDVEISRGESTTLKAHNTGESTLYKWHNLSNNSVVIGRSITVSPITTTKYKLEILSNMTGNKDYDEVEVKVKKYQILNMTPNPANNRVTISYRATNATSAYILLLKAYGNSSNHTLNVNQSSISISLTGRASGVYFAVLVCNGQAVDSKTLIIN